jgi:large subunit ribosomal protein L3
MAGRMGQDQVTVKNLKIIEVSPESNEVYIKGAIPGANNNLVLIAGNGQMVVETEAKPVAATADVAVEKPAEVPAEPVVEETKPAENQTENNPNT